MIRARRFALPRGGIFSPVYVDDLVDGIVAAAAHEDAAGHVLTLSGGIGVPNETFFGAYARHAGRRLVVLPAPLMLAATRAVQRGEVNAFSTRYLLRRGTYSIAKARDADRLRAAGRARRGPRAHARLACDVGRISTSLTLTSSGCATA